jgi:hypothetical protein
MPGLISGILEGYTLGSAISKDAQERQADVALQEAYKGMTPEQAADPQASMKALMTAGTSLAKRGQGKAGYEMMKQASTLETAAMQQNIAKMKQFQGGLELAGQVAQGANSYEDLMPALQHLEKVMPPDQLMGIVAEVKQAEQKGIPFADAQKHMLERGMTVSQNLNQELKSANQQLKVLEEQRRVDTERFRELAKEKDQALAQDKEDERRREFKITEDRKEKGFKLKEDLGKAQLALSKGRLDISKTDQERKQDKLELDIADKILKAGGNYEDLSPRAKRILAALDVSSEDKPTTNLQAEIKIPSATQEKRDADRTKILKDELADQQSKADKGDVRAKANVTAIQNELASITKKQAETAPTPETIDKLAKNRTVSINYGIKDPAKRVEEAEVKTALSQVNPKYWNSVKNPKTVTQITGALGVSREAENIANFIEKNPVQTGFWGAIVKKLDSFDPRSSADSALGSIGFAGNEAKLNKLVLDFANQYAKSARGGANPIATVTELKNALSTFGVRDMSAAAAAESFKYMGDHYLEQKGKEMFNDEKAIKPSYYKDSGASTLRDKTTPPTKGVDKNNPLLQ